MALSRRYGVIPIRVPVMPSQIDLRKCVVINRYARFVIPLVESCAHLEAGLRAGRCNQLHNGLERLQALACPRLADECEHPMLDLVPLAGPGRVVADRDVEPGRVSKGLNEVLPRPDARAVAATSVRADENLACVRIPLHTHGIPPPTDARDRELRCVVGHPHIDEPFVPADVVRAIRDGRALCKVREVVDIHSAGLALRAPAPPRSFEGAHALLLLPINRDHGLTAPSEPCHLGVDVPELGISVRGLPPLLVLHVPLKAEVEDFETTPNGV